MSTILNSIVYFQDHKDELGGLLDELVAGLKPQPGDIPAFTFATMVAALSKDPDKAITVAALAIMRLGEQATP